MQRRVSAALGKTAIVEQKVDDSIIGGLVLRVQDKMMDAQREGAAGCDAAAVAGLATSCTTGS